jgi:hypothetical protein
MSADLVNWLKIMNNLDSADVRSRRAFQSQRSALPQGSYEPIALKNSGLIVGRVADSLSVLREVERPHPSGPV